MSLNKTIYQNMGGWHQLLFLFLFVILGLCIGVVVIAIASVPFGLQVGTDLSESVPFLKIAQFIQALCLFLAPALLFAYIMQRKPNHYLKIDTIPASKTIVWTIVAVVAIQPIMQLSSYVNQQMILPESLHSLEMWMKTKELEVEKIIELFIADKSPLSYISNIIVIGIMAGIVEEFFFRGCLQNIWLKITKNKHAAIWITAIIFSTIHFQFYGFLPRLMAGALLGYLYYASQSLIVPIVAHIVHNALNVIVAQTLYGTSYYAQFDKTAIVDYPWLIVLSVALFTLLIFINKKIKVFLPESR